MEKRSREGNGNNKFQIQLKDGDSSSGYITSYLITLRTNFNDHYGQAVKEQCLDSIAEIDVFSVSDEML